MPSAAGHDGVAREPSPCRMRLRGRGRAADLYSEALVNTRRRHPRSGSRTPKTVGTGRDTPRLYSVYSFVFRCHLHTNSAPQPYWRKGFQICIQCIQRIPTPLVFRFSLLLGREYMNTVNTSGRDGGGGCRRAAACDAARPTGVGARGFVFSGPREYMRRPTPNKAPDARIGRKRPRHALNVCIVFSCIQMPNAYKSGPSALLP